MRVEQITPKSGEEGSALIIVVGMLAVLSLMALHLTVATDTLARETKTQAVRSQLKYAAESAANRALWFYLSDRKQYPNRNVGSPDALPADAEERWRADGTVHKMSIGPIEAEVRLKDANSGIDISGTQGPANLQKCLADIDTDIDTTVEREEVIDIFKDYIDSGSRDAVHLKGMEQEQYEMAGFPYLPRNGPLEYRDEILWIKGFLWVLPPVAKAVIPSETFPVRYFRLIPPRGYSFPNTGKPNFFATSEQLIRQMGNFNEDEMAAVIEARRLYISEGRDFLSSLVPELMGRLKAHFSFRESGVVTVNVEARSANAEIRRSLRLTRDCRRTNDTTRNHRVFRNWEKVLP